MHEGAWAYGAQERAGGRAHDERTHVEQTAILHGRRRATDGQTKAEQRRVLEGCSMR